MKILLCTNHLLVLNKPAGMLTQPTTSGEPSLECLGKEWLKKHYNKPGNVFLHAAHRIDRPVSGIVVFARTSKALSRLNESIRQTRFRKEYMAIVEGVVEEGERELEHYLQKGEFATSVVDKASPFAKKSLLKFRAIKGSGEYTLLRISLLTGRYHQIRAQLSAIGHPVLGDQKYGSKVPSHSLFLHHASLQFPDPITKDLLSLEAPLPDHWHSFSNFCS